MNEQLRFKCSCGKQLGYVAAMDHATQVVNRTCRRCGKRWQVMVEPLRIQDGMRIDKATLLQIPRMSVVRRALR
jgi:hypothetical protein